jgi:hypothetical protein
MVAWLDVVLVELNTVIMFFTILGLRVAYVAQAGSEYKGLFMALIGNVILGCFTVIVAVILAGIGAFISKKINKIP